MDVSSRIMAVVLFLSLNLCLINLPIKLLQYITLGRGATMATRKTERKERVVSQWGLGGKQCPPAAPSLDMRP